jgi:phenylacetate-CoA ligase
MDGTVDPPTTAFLEPEIERLDRSEIQALQLRLFNEEFERVRRGNAFFRDYYDRLGFRTGSMESFDAIRSIPVVRKDQVLRDAASQPPYGRRLQVSEHEIAQVVESSGTSGLGREVQALSSKDLDMIRHAKTFQFFWPGVRQGTVVGLNLPITMSAGGLWSLEALRGMGASVLRLGSMRVEDRLDYMKRYSVELIQVSTSYLMRLAVTAETLGYDVQKDFPRLRGIYVTGGGWSVEWARGVAGHWNARLFESYSSSQRIFAYTCEWGMLQGGHRGIIHFLPQLALAEVIDPATGEHVLDGEEGEIVITPFRMHAHPLIRYATGDRVRFRSGRTCPCGRQFDGIEAGSVTRFDDMMKIKGVNVWPATIDAMISRREVAEYRGDLSVDERGREVASIHLEFLDDVDGDTRQRLMADLMNRIHQEVRLHFVVDEWQGPSLIEDMSGFRDGSKIRRWNDHRTETRDSLQVGR